MNTRALACVVALMVSGLLAIGCGVAAPEEGEGSIWDVEQALLESEAPMLMESEADPYGESQPDADERDPAEKDKEHEGGGNDLLESEGDP